MKEFDSANEEGEKQATKFLEERVLTNKKQIYDQINLNKQRNFSKPTVVKNTGKVCKTDAMENRAMVKIISLAETATVDLEELMRYHLTEICLPLFNINGQMRKAVKSNFINSFEIHKTTLEGVSYISIVEMGFIWRLATPSIANRESAECDFTWGNYATKIFNIFLQHHPNAIEYHLVNDRYDVELSIKDAEHQKRNSMFLEGSRNIFPSSNLAVLLARTFNSFFGNAKNKIRLQDFLFKELTEFAKNHQKTFVYTLKERYYSINLVATLHCFFCHQHESDTRLFYHASKLDRRSDISSIVVDAEDTDPVIASYASFKFEKELLLYQKKKILLCKQLCLEDVSSVIISLHALTGADAVSSFYGHSKRPSTRKWKKS